jgi:hypothetical protein
MSNDVMNAFRILAVLGSLAALQPLLAQQTASPPETTQSTLSNARSGTPGQDTALLPTLPPVPRAQITLLGGIIDTVDRVRDGFVLRTFGGGHIKILFDERTRIYLDRMTAGHQRDLHHGQRVHVDAMLDGTQIFAHSIQVLPQAPTVECDGQVESYKASTGDLTVRDSSMATTVKVQLSASTVVRRNDRLIAPAEIPPRSLVSIAFQPEAGGRAVALEVSVLAEPGDKFTFSGRIMQLDMRAHLVVLEDPRDRRAYEIYLDPSDVQGTDRLHEGANVTIATSFDGARYVAAALIISP